MGTGDLHRVPPVAVRHGRARRSSGTGPCGDWRRIPWIPVTRGQYSGNIRFIEKPGVEDCGGRPVAKRSSDPRMHRVWVMGIVAPFVPRGVSIRGKFVLSRPGGKWPMSPVPGAPSSDTPWENQVKFRGGTVWADPVDTRPVGRYSGNIRESRSTRLG